MTRAGRAVALAACAGLACAGCTPAAWDAEALAVRHPTLGAGAGRLADAQPYLLPAAGVLTAFLCRWPEEHRIPVSFPPEASAAERRVLEAALEAWEQALPGLAFAPGPVAERGIELRFADADPDGLPGTANTIADCRVDPAAFAGSPRATLPARLVFASIHLYRHNDDVLERPVPLAPDQLAGSALHELGHALGYQGHASRGGSVMVRAVHDVRRAGARVLDGRRFRDDTLAALYRLPSGVVVRRLAVGGERTRPLDRMLELARARGFAGPFVRVGDRLGRIAWRDERGRWLSLLLPEPAGVLRGSRALELRPYGRAAALLRGRSSGR